MRKDIPDRMPRAWRRAVSFLALAVVWSVPAALPAESSFEAHECTAPLPNADCGSVAVALDRSGGSAGTLSLPVLRLEAGREGAPVVFLPGGPGQSAFDLRPLATDVYARVLEHRPAIFVGLRGADDEAPIDCLESLGSDPSLVFGALWNREAIGRCRETHSGRDLSHFNTRAYVHDVAAVLDALGYPKVVLWGGSGGARTALAFVREYPERVSAVALDGITPIDYRMPAPFAGHAEAAWQRVVTDCNAQPACAAAYPDLEGKLDRILARLDQGPVGTTIALGGDDEAESRTVAVDVHRGDFGYALRGLLYNTRRIPELPREITAAAASGDLSYFAQNHYDRTTAILRVLNVGVHLSSYCTEDVPRIEEGPGEGDTFLGSYLIDEYSAACEIWDVEPQPESWYRDFRSEVPALLVSGAYDPSTPASAAESVRGALPNSRHLVVRDASHGAGFGCARSLVEEFLVTGAVDGAAQPCPDAPITFEVPAD